MFKSGFILTTDDHIEAAMHNQTPVIAWQDGEIIDYGGPIEKHDEHTVTINGMHYVKATCVFKIR